MNNHHCAGRRLLFWGALALMALAGYECWARLSTIAWTVQGVYRMCVNEGIPFFRAWSYFDPQMLYLVGFLVACVLVGPFAMLFRNRPLAGYFFIAAMLALGYVAFGPLGLFSLSALKSMQTLKLIPMVMIVLGSLINLIQFYLSLRQRVRAPESHYVEQA